MDVVVRRYIDFLILLIRTPLVLALFSSIPTSLFVVKIFFRSFEVASHLIVVWSSEVVTARTFHNVLYTNILNQSRMKSFDKFITLRWLVNSYRTDVSYAETIITPSCGRMKF